MAIESSNESTTYIEFEITGWDAYTPGYNLYWVPLTRQSAEPLLDASGVGIDSHVLDVCCGPGFLVEKAISRGATAVGVDFSKVAVDIAKRAIPDGEFFVEDAHSLPFDNESFDAVVCAYGIIHVADPEVALAEMYRVLRPGGQVAFSAWETPKPSNGFGLVFGALQMHGTLDVPMPHAPNLFQFSDEEIIQEAMDSVSFQSVKVQTVEQIWRMDTPLGILDAITEGTVRARTILLSQTEEARQAIDKAVRDGVEKYRSIDGYYDIPMPAVISSGTK